MKVLHVIPSLVRSSGGPAYNTVALAQQFEARGHQVTIATTDASTPANSEKPMGGANINDFPAGAENLDIRIFPLTRPYSFAYSRKLGLFLQRHVDDYDLVHVHSVNLYPQMAAWKAATRSKVPYIVSPRGALDPWIRGKRRLVKELNDRLWHRRMLNEASALHLTTIDEKKLIEPLNLKSPKWVIPNAFDVSRFSQRAEPDAFRQTWLRNYQGPLILNHGRLSEKKGLEILIDAFAVARRSQSVHLALVGADDEGTGRKLRRKIDALGLEEDVTLVPIQSGVNLVSAVQAADIWVLPSYSENFGMAVAEAMAAGKAVVTSPYVNIAPEAASSDALLMVPNTVAAVTAALLSLLQDSHARHELGEAAARYAQRYDWSYVADSFVELYEAMVRSSH